MDYQSISQKWHHLHRLYCTSIQFLSGIFGCYLECYLTNFHFNRNGMCINCQRNKLWMMKPAGLLHPSPVPNGRGDSVAIDFIGPLPVDEGFNIIGSLTDRLGSNIQLIPTLTTLTADEMALLFFNHWYCKNGLPKTIVCNHDKLFISHFWKALHKLIEVSI